MDESSRRVEQHYAQPALAARILAALRQGGHTSEAVAAELLYPVDQLHARELAATREQTAKLHLDAGKRVLDVGSGVGGPARYMASTYGCHVTGVDLTPDFVEAAAELTALAGLSARVKFLVGDARAMPFADGSFDAATCLYVAMNIPDKASVLAEIHRLLVPGGRLVWTQAVLRSQAAPTYPLPWARDEHASFLLTEQALARLFEEAGFRIVEWTDETEQHRAFVQQAKAAPTAPPSALTRELVVGEDIKERLQNFNRAIEEGTLAPLLAVAERP